MVTLKVGSYMHKSRGEIEFPILEAAGYAPISIFLDALRDDGFAVPDDRPEPEEGGGEGGMGGGGGTIADDVGDDIPF